MDRSSCMFPTARSRLAPSRLARAAAGRARAGAPRGAPSRLARSRRAPSRRAPTRLAPTRRASSRLAPTRLARFFTANFMARPSFTPYSSFSSHSISAVKTMFPVHLCLISNFILSSEIDGGVWNESLRNGGHHISRGALIKFELLHQPLFGFAHDAGAVPGVLLALFFFSSFSGFFRTAISLGALKSGILGRNPVDLRLRFRFGLRLGFCCGPARCGFLAFLYGFFLALFAGGLFGCAALGSEALSVGTFPLLTLGP